MAKAFSEHEKELIRKRLLEQGYRLFSAFGPKKTNIEDIAQATGISKGAFYIFYQSKEALFFDVIEEAEKRIRQEILEAVDQPGPTQRERLFAVLHKAFTLIRNIPILKFITGSDYELIFRRIPPEKLQEHLVNDLAFMQELFGRLRTAGIALRVQPEQIFELLYPLALSLIHEDELPVNALKGNMDVFLELVAAFCLGEVELQLQGQEGKVR
ncbi:MAG: TetR/AcrR family transcriptional regulator [Terriglobia bacterium]